MNELDKIVMYYYYDKKGNKLWTGNAAVANTRARIHGTNDIYQVITDQTPKNER